MAGVRTIITLPEQDKEWLESYSRSHKISTAEAIRQGIQKLKDAEYNDTYRILLKGTKGTWKKGDALEYKRKIRSEWGS